VIVNLLVVLVVYIGYLEIKFKNQNFVRSATMRYNVISNPKPDRRQSILSVIADKIYDRLKKQTKIKHRKKHRRTCENCEQERSLSKIAGMRLCRHCKNAFKYNFKFIKSERRWVKL